MVHKEEAKRLVEEHYKSDPNDPLGKWVVVDHSTIETAYGWVFFVATERFLETRNFRHLPPGNSPILILKRDGRLVELGTALPAEDALREFEADPESFAQ